MVQSQEMKVLKTQMSRFSCGAESSLYTAVFPNSGILDMHRQTIHSGHSAAEQLCALVPYSML